MTVENALKNQQNVETSEEPSVWDLRCEWKVAYRTCQRIRAHVAKLQDGRHTILSDNGLDLILDEQSRLTNRMKEIEALFKVKRWSL